MKSTIIDVAKLAGMSIATVSRVINNKPVRPESYEKVVKAIKQLDYEANNSARSLKTNKTRNIGMVVPYLDFFYFMRIMKKAQEYLHKHGYSVFIVDSDSIFEREKNQVKRLIDLNVDGLIVVLSENSFSYIDEFQPNIPVVLVDKIPENCKHDVVVCDGSSIVYQAVEHFIKNGHRRIGIICGPKRFFTGRDRLSGYLRVLEDYQIPIDETLIKHIEYNVQSSQLAYEAMNEFVAMDKSKQPTALLTASYDCTKGSLLAIRDMAIKIPEELSFIGYDFEELYDFYSPKMSMVFENFDEIGTQIAKLLLLQLRNNKKNVPTIVRTKSNLVLGNSVKKIN